MELEISTYTGVIIATCVRVAGTCVVKIRVKVVWLAFCEQEGKRKMLQDVVTGTEAIVRLPQTRFHTRLRTFRSFVFQVLSLEQ